jgi:anti-sigma regulatory factor (Ser/Thr protein kinase)
VERRPLADEASLPGIRRAIRKALVRAGADPSVAFDCLVALTEACTNALVHGSHEDATPEVSWAIADGEARFEVRDFSPRGWGNGEATSGDGEERHGGYGMGLMEGLMDEFDVEVGPTGTVVKMMKRLRS